MKYFLGFVSGIMFIIGMAFIAPTPEGKIYDCGMAEWHPDIPEEVKEECRNRQMRPRLTT